jgi:molybdenum cofactor guanylyltransferase
MVLPFDALVLAGGHARRFGADKLDAVVDARTVLDRTLDATTGAAVVVCVGPERAVGPMVVWTREDPPGTGPVPGIAAGLLLTSAPWLLLLGGDMPDAAPAAAQLLAAARAQGRGDAEHEHCVYVAVASDGRVQPLLSLWPTALLRERVDTVLAGPRRSVTALTEGTTVVRVRVDDAAVRDIDTRDDLGDRSRGQ